MKISIEANLDPIGEVINLQINVDGKAVYPPNGDTKPNPLPIPLPPATPVSFTEPEPTSLAMSAFAKVAPLPKGAMKKAGDTYRNAYGYVIEQLTDEPTGAQHFYVHPHPINCAGDKLVFTASQGGGLFHKDLKTGMVTQIITSRNETPTSYAWHPTNPNRLFLAIQQGLYTYDCNPNLHLLARLKDLSVPWTQAPLFLNATDGNRFVFDYRQQSKVSHGVALLDLTASVSGDLRTFQGNTVEGAPLGMNLTGASADTSMQFIFTQVNGSDPSTLTYTCRWHDNPLLDSSLMLPPVPQAPRGIVTNHGCTTSLMHHRICGSAQGDGVGYLPASANDPSGTPRWLSAVRSLELTSGKQEDRFVWHPSNGYGGIHLSGNDDQLLLSTYKETPMLPNEQAEAFNGELVLLDINETAIVEPKYPQPSVVINPPVLRICSHGSSGQGYWGQPRASLAPNGKEAVFTSDVSGTLQVYRVHLAQRLFA